MSDARITRILDAFAIVTFVLLCILMMGRDDISPLIKCPIVLVGSMSAAIILYGDYNVYQQKKWEEARDFLLESTSKAYFYGYPLSDCIKAGVFERLAFENVGDFGMPVGLLLLSILRDKQQEDEPLIYYETLSSQLEDKSARKWRNVYVSFEYAGRYWMYELNGFGLDESTLRPASSVSLTGNYREMSYWEANRAERKSVNCCMIQSRSELPPERKYADCSSDEFTVKVKETIGFCLQSN